MMEKMTSRSLSPLSPLVAPGAAVMTAALSAACLAMLIFREVLTDETRHLFMLWNLFLAWIPYAAAVAAGVILKLFPSGGWLRGTVILAVGSVWLLFLPNSAYMTTDLIHLISGQRRYITAGGFGYLVWFDIVLFFLFAWIGILLGYLSMLQFHRMTARRYGAAAGWMFALTASLLAGYGVFLGRVVRLNSWDAWLRPEELLRNVLDSLHLRGIAFSLLFGFLIAATYATLYQLQESKR